jgi:Holliday junction resolvase
MKRLPRDPVRFDVINAFAEFGRSEKISLRNPAAADSFVERARASINRSLSNEAFLQGLRTELMFESLVASLGAVEILKSEDSGEIYVSDETLKVPDFRLVLADGSQMLVEVKNFYQGQDLRRSFELDGAYLEGLVRYSKAMNCNLLLAIYWAKWNIWTLVRPEVFHNQNEKRTIDMVEAMKANHMVSLGDYSIGTRFPLSLVMHADESKPRYVRPDGSGTFTISNVEFYCAGQLIADPVEQRIATYLMFYGNWTYAAEPRIVENEIEAVEHRWVPEVDHEQGFEIVGSLSEMFSTFYKFATQDEGQMGKLRLDITPGSWGNLIPEDHKGKMLPLWRLRLRPSPSADNRPCL